MLQPKDLRVLVFGIDPGTRAVLQGILAPEQILDQPYNLEKMMELQVNPPPFAILCGPPREEIPVIEVAQMLRMQFQNIPIHYVTTDRANFDRKVFRKNGFTDAFLYPVDSSELKLSMTEELAKASKGEIRVFRPVKVVDVKAGAVLPFDTFVYLPMNKKHIRYSEAGVALDEERTSRLVKHDVNSLHIPAEQMKSFYDFTASQLRTLTDSTAISETEKQDRMKNAIRDLMSGIFNDSAGEASTTHGKAVIENCQQIVKSYIVNGPSTANNWYEKILNISGNASSSYSHSGNVATYAALFSMALCMGKAEEIAIAAVLHDIGIAALPPELQLKSPEDFTPEEFKIYQTHPELTIKFVQERKLILSEDIHKMILQHHERFNGSGYPRGLQGARITIGAQILALADEFDYLSCVRDGKPSLSPPAALEALRKKASGDPASALFDAALVAKLVDVFNPAKKSA